MKCGHVSDEYHGRIICDRELGHKGIHRNGTRYWETDCGKCLFSDNGVLDSVVDDCEIHKDDFE